jgi:hypothetical protein
MFFSPAMDLPMFATPPGNFDDWCLRVENPPGWPKQQKTSSEKCTMTQFQQLHATALYAKHAMALYVKQAM